MGITGATQTASEHSTQPCLPGGVPCCSGRKVSRAQQNDDTSSYPKQTNKTRLHEKHFWNTLHYSIRETLKTDSALLGNFLGRRLTTQQAPETMLATLPARPQPHVHHHPGRLLVNSKGQESPARGGDHYETSGPPSCESHSPVWQLKRPWDPPSLHLETPSTNTANPGGHKAHAHLLQRVVAAFIYNRFLSINELGPLSASESDMNKRNEVRSTIKKHLYLG